ncbi:MAG: proline racemase family protein, partial [Alphaproteobacteria bacterium]|nr:proline racemase family protein [Alphaproteobacteria bacterium]
GRAALLYAKGRLALNETLINESLLGTIMTGRVLRAITYCGLDAVVPEVSGSAFICGQATWMVDRNDTLRHGFLVR